MSSANYRERLRDRQGPASLNPSFRPATNHHRRDRIVLRDMTPAPVDTAPTPDPEVEEPLLPPLPPHNPTQTGLLSHFQNTTANAGTNPPPAADPRAGTMQAMLQEEDQRFIDHVNRALVPGSASAGSEDNDPVEDPTDPLVGEGSDSLGKPQ